MILSTMAEPKHDANPLGEKLDMEIKPLPSLTGDNVKGDTLLVDSEEERAILKKIDLQ
jgi:hypothetical protein